MFRFYRKKLIPTVLSWSFVFFYVAACGMKKQEEIKQEEKKRTFEHQLEQYGDTLQVTASAYNLISSQTLSDPNLGAWGDTLTNEDKVIAVSQDLLENGLTHNTKVKIKGFKGVFRVRDRMPSRWRNRIDILMGTDVEKAKEFGVQETEIYVVHPDKEDEDI